MRQGLLQIFPALGKAHRDDGVFQLRAVADMDNFSIQPRGSAAHCRPELIRERTVNHADDGLVMRDA